MTDHRQGETEAEAAAMDAVVKSVAKEFRSLTRRFMAHEIDAHTYGERYAELTSPEILQVRFEQALNTTATPAAVDEAIERGQSVLKFGDVVLAIQGETVSEEELETRYRLARREMRRIVRDELGFDL